MNKLRLALPRQGGQNPQPPRIGHDRIKGKLNRHAPPYRACETLYLTALAQVSRALHPRPVSCRDLSRGPRLAVPPARAAHPPHKASSPAPAPPPSAARPAPRQSPPPAPPATPARKSSARAAATPSSSAPAARAHTLPASVPRRTTQPPTTLFPAIHSRPTASQESATPAGQNLE